MKKKYSVPCSWEVYGTTIVEAESWAEAISEAEAAPLPADSSYIEDSFKIEGDTSL
jgi:hypothetical protein